MDENKDLSLDELTPEEEQELAQYEQIESQSSSQTDLTPEEEQEFAQYEQQDQMLAAEMSGTNAAMAGIAEGLTLNFADEIAGSFGAVKDVVMDDETSIADFYQSYKKNRNQFRKAFDELEKKYPLEFNTAKTTGAFISNAPAVLATGGNPLAMGALGAMQGLGDTEEITDLPNVAKDVSIDAILSMGVGSAGKAIGHAGHAAAIQLKNARTAIVNQFDSPIMKKLKNVIVDGALSSVGMNSSAAKTISKSLFNFAKTEQLPKKAAESLTYISKAMEANPTRWDLTAARMAMAGQASTLDMVKDLAFIESALNLEASPVNRTTEDVMRKKNHITTLIDQIDPTISDQLDLAIANSDSQKVGSIMSLASMLPESKRYIMDGVGWDGRVFHPEEMAMVERSIEQSRKPAWQKKQELEDLRSAGTIPMQPPAPYYKKKPIQTIINEKGKKVGDY